MLRQGKRGYGHGGKRHLRCLKRCFRRLRLIVSIDQLYLQASLMQPIFIAKVCKWALASSAYFPHKSVADGFIAWLDASRCASHTATHRNTPQHTATHCVADGFIAWLIASRCALVCVSMCVCVRVYNINIYTKHIDKIDASRDASLAANIKWASIKRPGRSFEKVYRSYCNDVSRLVDVVRQQIVFKTVRHVLGMFCNTLQRTATHCNTLQHTAAHGNTLQHTSTDCLQDCASCPRYVLQYTATHCNTLQHTALQHTATHCNTL